MFERFYFGFKIFNIRLNIFDVFNIKAAIKVASANNIEKKVLTLMLVSLFVTVVLLALTIVYAQITCPSDRPFYSQPGIKLTYYITSRDYISNSTVNMLRTESVISRYFGNYIANVKIINLTGSMFGNEVIMDENGTFQILNGYAMEEIPVYSGLMPIGMKSFSVDGITLWGMEFYDPYSGARITIDLDRGIILGILVNQYPQYLNITLIDIEGGIACHAWTR